MTVLSLIYFELFYLFSIWTFLSLFYLEFFISKIKDRKMAWSWHWIRWQWNSCRVCRRNMNLMAISISHFALVRSLMKKQIFSDRKILKNSTAIWWSQWNSCRMALHNVINFHLFWRWSKSRFLSCSLYLISIWTILSLFYLELPIPFLFGLFYPEFSIPFLFGLVPFLCGLSYRFSLIFNFFHLFFSLDHGLILDFLHNFFAI